MERYCNINDIYYKIKKEKQKGVKNAFLTPFLSFCEYCYDSSKILEIEEILANLKADEIFEKFSLKNEDLEKIYTKILIENIQNGVSEINMLSLNPFLSMKLYKQFDLTGFIFVRIQDFQETYVKQFDNKKIRLGIYVDPYFNGDEKCNLASELSGKYHLPVIVKLYDDLNKTGELSKHYGQSPISYIENLGLLDRECYILSPVCADKDDFEVIANYGSKIIVDIYDSLNQARGSPNVYSMLNCGCEVQIASPIICNPLKECEVLSLISRGNLNENNIMSMKDCLELALCDNTAKCIEEINLEKEIEKILIKIKENF